MSHCPCILIPQQFISLETFIAHTCYVLPFICVMSDWKSNGSDYLLMELFGFDWDQQLMVPIVSNIGRDWWGWGKEEFEIEDFIAHVNSIPVITDSMFVLKLGGMSQRLRYFEQMQFKS